MISFVRRFIHYPFSEPFKAGLIFLTFFVVFLGVYSPVIFGYFATYDDYAIFGHTLPWPPDFAQASLGRFLGPYILFVCSELLGTISDLNWVRLVSVSILSVSAFICYRWLCLFFKQKIPAFLFSLLIFTLPPFQACTFAGNNILLTTGLLLAVLAALFARRAALEKKEALGNSLAGGVLLLLAFMIYQPSAMFYWVMAGIFFSPFVATYSSLRKRPILIFVSIGLCVIAIYSVMLLKTGRWVVLFTGHSFNVARVKWLIENPLSSAFNLWNIFPTHGQAVVTAAVILTGNVVSLVRARELPAVRKKQQLSLVCYRLFIIVSLIIISSALLLCPSVYVTAYRYEAGFTPLVLLGLLWSWQEEFNRIQNVTLRKRVLITVLSIVCLGAAATAHYNVLYYRVIPSHKEFVYVLKNLSEHDLLRYKKIVMLAPEKEHLWTAPLPKNFAEEFLSLTTYQPWFHKAILHRALVELNMRPMFFTVQGTEAVRCEVPSVTGEFPNFFTVESYNFNEYHDNDPQALVIDMNKLK